MSIEQQVRDEVQRLIEVCETHFNLSLPTPRVKFDLEGRRSGTARIDGSEVDFNLVLLSENFDKFMASTVPHEVAHAVLGMVHVHRVQAHGKEWKALMRTLGAEPNRCHDYDVSNVKGRKLRHFTYACACMEYQLTTVRHNRILRGGAYRCRKCGQHLTRGELNP